MIRSFRYSETEKLFLRHRSRRFRNIERVAQWKLRLLHDAETLKDLAAVPGNRRGQCSIRINDQWRICFEWQNRGAENVEIVGYH